jgi:hypothetical protein
LNNVGDAPPLRQRKFKLTATAPFQAIADYLRKMLHYKPTDPLVPFIALLRCQSLSPVQFLFINATFQPNPEAPVADLYKVRVPSYATAKDACSASRQMGSWWSTTAPPLPGAEQRPNAAAVLCCRWRPRDLRPGRVRPCALALLLHGKQWSYPRNSTCSQSR